MFYRILPRISITMKRFSSDCSKPKRYKVAVVGGSGAIGQPLSLLLKLNPSIGELRIHDKKNTPGVAADLSHIETIAKITHTNGKEKLEEAFKGCVDIIVVAAGEPRKPGMERADLFNANAEIAFEVTKAMAKASPKSYLLLITNPVNSLVPIACEVLLKENICPNKVMGLTTLDLVRAATFVAELSCTDPKDVSVPVIGGHSAPTMVPLLSRACPEVKIEGAEREKLVKRIKEAGTEVIKAKDGKGSATLSTAYSAARLTFAIIRAMSGEQNIVESAYVKSDVHPEVKYFATPLLLGKDGVEKNLGLGKLNDYESKMLCDAIPLLQNDIKQGEQFVKEQECKSICEKMKNRGSGGGAPASPPAKAPDSKPPPNPAGGKPPVKATESKSSAKVEDKKPPVKAADNKPPPKPASKPIVPTVKK